MTKLIAIASILACSGVASAQTYVAMDDRGYSREPSEPMFKELDMRLGFLVGGSDVGDADGMALGVSGGLGYRLSDVTLRGTFDYYRVGDGVDEGMARNGRASRLGGALRYSFAHNSYEKSFGGDFWGEIGAGYEHVAWRHGGILDRPSGELAFGLDGVWRSQGERGRHKKIGYSLAFRSLIAQGPEMDGVTATCGGPCTQATKPSRTDVSMFFELGVHWGR
jgi:hypothetical protein